MSTFLDNETNRNLRAREDQRTLQLVGQGQFGDVWGGIRVSPEWRQKVESLPPYMDTTPDTQNADGSFKFVLGIDAIGSVSI